MFFTLKTALAQSGFRPPWWAILFCILGLLFAGTTFALLTLKLTGNDPKPKLEALWEQLRTGTPSVDERSLARPELADEPGGAAAAPEPHPTPAIDWTVASPDLDTIAFIDWAKTHLRRATTKIRYHRQLIIQEHKHYRNLLAETERDHRQLYETFGRLKHDYLAETAVSLPDRPYPPAEGTFLAKELRREVLESAGQATALWPQLVSERASLRVVLGRIRDLDGQLTRARDLEKVADLKLRVFGTTGEVRGLEELRGEVLALIGLLESAADG